MYRPGQPRRRAGGSPPKILQMQHLKYYICLMLLEASAARLRVLPSCWDRAERVRRCKTTIIGATTFIAEGHRWARRSPPDRLAATQINPGWMWKLPS